MSAIIDLIRERFKSTGVKPVTGRYITAEGCCGIGVLFLNFGLTNEEVKDMPSRDKVNVINASYDIVVTVEDVQQVIMGWDMFRPHRDRLKTIEPLKAQAYHLRKEIECSLNISSEDENSLIGQLPKQVSTHK